MKKPYNPTDRGVVHPFNPGTARKPIAEKYVLEDLNEWPTMCVSEDMLDTGEWHRWVNHAMSLDIDGADDVQTIGVVLGKEIRKAKWADVKRLYPAGRSTYRELLMRHALGVYLFEHVDWRWIGSAIVGDALENLRRGYVHCEDVSAPE